MSICSSCVVLLSSSRHWCERPQTLHSTIRVCESIQSRNLIGPLRKLEVLKSIFSLSQLLFHIDDTSEVITEIRDFLQRNPECKWKAIQVKCGRKPLISGVVNCANVKEAAEIIFTKTGLTRNLGLLYQSTVEKPLESQVFGQSLVLVSICNFLLVFFLEQSLKVTFSLGTLLGSYPLDPYPVLLLVKLLSLIPFVSPVSFDSSSVSSRVKRLLCQCGWFFAPLQLQYPRSKYQLSLGKEPIR